MQKLVTMKYAICNETFQGWDWEATCRHVAELGYAGIELAPYTLAEDVRRIGHSERTAVARAAESAGLQIVGLHWLLVSPKGLSLTTDEDAVRTETAAYLAALADFCADVGGRIMVLGSPAQRRIGDGQTRAAAVGRLEESLAPALEMCQRHGVTLCLEPLPGPEADLVLTLDEAVTIVDEIGHPSLKTIFDVKSASSEGRPLPELIREFAPHIAHVHANDANRRGPGFGETDYRPILSSLTDVGYRGFVSVEVFDYTADATTIARDSLAYMRACE